MSTPVRTLYATEAARRLGISTKALRLYERRGLIAPGRTAAGWRAYGPDELARAAEVVALRALGLGLAEVTRALRGDRRGLEPALAAHQAALEGRVGQLGAAIEELRALRARLAGDGARELAPRPGPAAAPVVRFALPWPWGGEPFELRALRPLSYLVGPLGSGKTRLARRLAEELPGAAFLGLERLAAGAAARARLDADPALAARVDRARARLVDDGATTSGALLALLVGLEADGPAALVVDMVEDELDHATQRVLIAYLRERAAAGACPLVLMTRSSAILDLAAVGPGEAILFCPANHSPPVWVSSAPGAPGREAVATCLASPAVRARTRGVIACRPAAA